MKKTLLLLSALAVGFSSFAQKSVKSGKDVVLTSIETTSPISSLAKTTVTPDTVFGKISFNSAFGHLYTYGTSGHDSGYVAGLNVYGDKGYAQRYDFNGADSSVSVLGAIIFFGGKYASTTTKTVTVKCWSVGSPAVITSSRPHLKYSGLPNATIGQTASMSIKSLGIYTGGDSLKRYYFTTPVTPANAASSFFVGAEFSTYTGTALAGDTVAIATDSARSLAINVVSGSDTLFNDINAVESTSGTWDDYYINTGYPIDFYIIPIMLVKNYNTGFQGVTRNNLTWYGNYPNPANNTTNFKFALATTADVTIEITDMSGRKMDVISQTNVGVGTHEIPYNTSKLATGNYIYMIRTSTGGAMASQLSVVK